MLLIFIVNMYGLFLRKEKGVTMTDAFQKMLNESKCKLNKIWVDKGKEFYNRSMESCLK